MLIGALVWAFKRHAVNVLAVTVWVAMGAALLFLLAVEIFSGQR